MSTMKFGQLHKTVLMLAGLVLLVCGIACVVIGILLEHGDMNATAGSRSRTNGSQYWLGLPLIAYGALTIVLSLGPKRRRKLIFVGVLLSIPMIIALCVGSILHGSSYKYFLPRQKERTSLAGRGYICIDVGEDRQECQCTKSLSNFHHFPYPCGGGPHGLVVYHGAIVSFAVIAIGITFGVFTFNIAYLLRTSYFKPPVHSDSLGNRFFSHQSRNHTHTIIRSTNFTQNPPLLGGPVTQTDLQAPRTQTEFETLTLPSQDQTRQLYRGAPALVEPPPCYESLVSGFPLTAIPNTMREEESYTEQQEERTQTELKTPTQPSQDQTGPLYTGTPASTEPPPCYESLVSGFPLTAVPKVYSNPLQSSRQPPKSQRTSQDISSSGAVTCRPGVTSERRLEVTSEGVVHSRVAIL